MRVKISKTDLAKAIGAHPNEIFYISELDRARWVEGGCRDSEYMDMLRGLSNIDSIELDAEPVKTEPCLRRKLSMHPADSYSWFYQGLFDEFDNIYAILREMREKNG